MGGGVGADLHQLHDIVSVDSATGIHVFVKPDGRIELSDSVIYGDRDMPNKDCPEGASCVCKARVGLLAPNFGS